MKIQLESQFNISNQGYYSSEYDDLILCKITTKIMLDISENLTEDEYYEREEKGDDFLLYMGRISCSRFNLRYSERDLYFVANAQNLDFKKVISYFFYDKGKKEFSYFSPNAIYYINNVIIKPEYRGHDYGLYGLSLLLGFY